MIVEVCILGIASASIGAYAFRLWRNMNIREDAVSTEVHLPEASVGKQKSYYGRIAANDGDRVRWTRKHENSSIIIWQARYKDYDISEYVRQKTQPTTVYWEFVVSSHMMKHTVHKQLAIHNERHKSDFEIEWEELL